MRSVATSVWIKVAKSPGASAARSSITIPRSRARASRIDQIDLLFECRFHQSSGEARRDQLGVLVGDVTPIRDLGILERPTVHLRVEHSQPPGQVEVEAHVLELGAIEGRHVDGEPNLTAGQEVAEQPAGLDGNRDLGLLGGGTQVRRDHNLGMADQGVIRRRRLGVEDVDRRAGDLAAIEGFQRAASSIRPPRAQLMMRTDGFIMAISRAPIRLRVSAVSGVCRVRKSQRPQRSSSRATLSTPNSSALSAARNGSKPRTVIPKPCARLATASPTRPRPITPRVLPSSCEPVNLVRSHLPDLRLSLALATFRASGQQQCHRVLGRRDRVSARRIHHHDPAPGRGRDVDVIDAHARANDRLEPGLAFQNLGRQLRARSDHDAVGLEQR